MTDTATLVPKTNYNLVPTANEDESSAPLR
jgi:hypothetical protein